ncbi:MAG: hypothetical protein ABIT82_01325, partial [Ramlibacter sp.]
MPHAIRTSPFRARRAASGWLFALASTVATAASVVAPEAPAVPPAIQQVAEAVAAELAANCPLATAGDTGAYNSCRQALFGPSVLRSHLPAFIIWGRQGKNANTT